MKTYRILSYDELREARICEEYSCLVGPDGFECTLTEPEDRTWGRDLLPVVERLNEYADRITELEQQLAAEKKRRIYYQDIVYSVCNVLDIDDRHSGNVIVCGTAEEPCSDIETRIQQLTAERDSLRQQLAAAQKNRCEHCGATIINNCPVCGAPQCCPQCCRIDLLEHQLTAANAEIERLSAELAPLGLPAPFIARPAANLKEE